MAWIHDFGQILLNLFNHLIFFSVGPPRTGKHCYSTCDILPKLPAGGKYSDEFPFKQLPLPHHPHWWSSPVWDDHYHQLWSCSVWQDDHHHCDQFGMMKSYLLLDSILGTTFMFFLQVSTHNYLSMRSIVVITTMMTTMLSMIKICQIIRMMTILTMIIMRKMEMIWMMTMKTTKLAITKIVYVCFESVILLISSQLCCRVSQTV